ncbi:hypothetical protein PsorP6_017105 [Peronosclerospora sorghi]|uniref:Uncharacterized protein n=1 Tax=Peronosclerospora sorghi TaxID=230839 RepID=A0ACC0WFI5_9STRA|nr:hypothetical protein PsorP6_017105 [Peronosclerospora sorghi]
MSETAGDALELRLKLKLPRSISTSSATEKLLIGARGGAAVKELLSTAPNIEVAIREFQAAHGIAEAHAKLFVRRKENMKDEETPTSFNPAVELLDLIQVPRSRVHQSLLDQMKKEMLLRIADLPQSDLPHVLEQTFPYIEFRELRAIPIAVLARQEETPDRYLREITENRRILAELPIHVRRKILQVDRRELQLVVEECTREYVTEQLEWYLHHPMLQSTAAQRFLSRRNSTNSMRSGTKYRKRSLEESTAGNLWNVSTHVPSSADAARSSVASSAFSGERRPSFSPDERRRNNPALMKLVEMLGDSESLYLSTLEIWRGYVVAANIPGSATNNNPKEYVDYVALLGAMRNDLANLQRDKTTLLLRTDPLHKFIWFLDRALKNQTLQTAQLQELLGFVSRLRTSDLPSNKKIRKKGGLDEEEESFEVVLGPPPVNELLAVLDKIAKIDARLIFAEPVPDDVPKYREIIKDPMDLSTMRKKAKRGKYKTLEAFVSDFNLMIRNCITFNPDTTIFYKEGKRIGKRGNEIIERNAVALRGEPQRIRTKKRRKIGTGPTSEALNMLTSSGVVTVKDFGDVDQAGMVPEGLCEEQLADVALVLSDPLVKQLICDALMKNLVVCWQKKELPTDNLTCRALVQLLQIGNPSSIRRMIRKQDFVLRTPQVVTMRVVLPLLLRTMVDLRVYYAFPGELKRDMKLKTNEDLLNVVLWNNVLRSSSAIRTLVKSFAVQCLVDHQIDAGSQLLHRLLSAEEETLLRDRVLLHAVAEVVLEQVKLVAACTNGGSEAGQTTAENGEVTVTLSEQVQALEVWKLIVDGFFVDVLAKRILAAKDATGFICRFVEGAVAPVELCNNNTTASGEVLSKKRKREQMVESFPCPVFHEKAVMVLSSLFAVVEKGGPEVSNNAMIASYIKKTLVVLRTCCLSLDEFEALWNSPVFAGCRYFYKTMLLRCPLVQDELFADLPTDIATDAVNVSKGTLNVTSLTNMQRTDMDVTLENASSDREVVENAKKFGGDGNATTSDSEGPVINEDAEVVVALEDADKASLATPSNTLVADNTTILTSDVAITTFIQSEDASPKKSDKMADGAEDGASLDAGKIENFETGDENIGAEDGTSLVAGKTENFETGDESIGNIDVRREAVEMTSMLNARATNTVSSPISSDNAIGISTTSIANAPTVQNGDAFDATDEAVGTEHAG